MAYQMMVLSNPTPGREDEYNQWYDDVHLGEVLTVPGFTAAQRFALDDTQIGDAPEFRYLAIYEFDCEPKEAAERLMAASDSFNMSDALGDASPMIFRPITDRRTG